MSKVRVFELARELNIPGKELLARMKALGFQVDGNFNVMDEDLVAQVKAKMLEPMSRVEKQAGGRPDQPGETPEAAGALRKRRIISARRSEEVHKIQESLGVSGPLPEDEQTREELNRVEEPPPPVEPPPPPPVVEIVRPKPRVEEEDTRGKAKPGKKRELEPEKSSWRDVKRPGNRGAPGAGDKGRWRDMKQVVPTPDGDEWVRQRRRRGDKRRKTPQQEEHQPITAVRKKAIKIGPTITVAELAGAIGVKSGEIIKKLMELGVVATINQPLDGTVSELLASAFNMEVEVDTRNLEDLVKEEAAAPEDLEPRVPIVTVMGHVDHGKTSLLDSIRKTDVTRGEAGGITQHIGAYYVKHPSGDVVFLDTPGHEAFTSLRARGADITDLVILVVAADDGVMPQTIEAIDHAKAAKVPIMVAINKIDKPGANPERIKTQLMEHGLVSEEFGGDTVFVPVSAKTGQGMDSLLEMIHLQAEMLALKASRKGLPRGYVIESGMDRQRGPVATVLMQRGVMKVGDHFVAGATFGRVRAMFNDRGKQIAEAGPSEPVEILGCNEPPQAGDLFVVMEDEKVARQIATVRANQRRTTENAARRHVHLEDFLQGAKENETATLNLVIKTDAQGSLEAIKGSLSKMSGDRVRVAFVRSAVGGITETDISLAATTDAIIIGFCVRPEAKARELALREGIDIKQYTVIYDLINDVKAAMEGLLKPVVREEVVGHFEVRRVFSPQKGGAVLGGMVTSGKLVRANAFIRVYRDNVLVHTGQLASLRRFTEDVNEVAEGYECGLRLANYTDVKMGDALEAFVKVEETQSLS
ncbi:MAG: translation initiation factor IF-2 [Deltaproteobacteria bacterium]|nr:translation initiation factor IF-2 [Deltaproteobacteria bacterium]